MERLAVATLVTLRVDRWLGRITECVGREKGEILDGIYPSWQADNLYPSAMAWVIQRPCTTIHIGTWLRREEPSEQRDIRRWVSSHLLQSHPTHWIKCSLEYVTDVEKG